MAKQAFRVAFFLPVYVSLLFSGSFPEDKMMIVTSFVWHFSNKNIMVAVINGLFRITELNY